MSEDINDTPAPEAVEAETDPYSLSRPAADFERMGHTEAIAALSLEHTHALRILLDVYAQRAQVAYHASRKATWDRAVATDEENAEAQEAARRAKVEADANFELAQTMTRRIEAVLEER